MLMFLFDSTQKNSDPRHGIVMGAFIVVLGCAYACKEYLKHKTDIGYDEFVQEIIRAVFHKKADDVIRNLFYSIDDTKTPKGYTYDLSDFLSYAKTLNASDLDKLTAFIKDLQTTNPNKKHMIWVIRQQLRHIQYQKKRMIKSNQNHR